MEKILVDSREFLFEGLVECSDDVLVPTHVPLPPECNISIAVASGRPQAVMILVV
jgi:hypothetical protein